MHKDPEWWLRCAEVKPTRPTLTDLCALCGHIRGLHGPDGCVAPSTSIVDAPYPCDCTNRWDGTIYRDAATLHQLTSRS